MSKYSLLHSRWNKKALKQRKKRIDCSTLFILRVCDNQLNRWNIFSYNDLIIKLIIIQEVNLELCINQTKINCDIMEYCYFIITIKANECSRNDKDHFLYPHAIEYKFHNYTWRNNYEYLQHKDIGILLILARMEKEVNI